MFAHTSFPTEAEIAVLVPESGSKRAMTYTVAERGLQKKVKDGRGMKVPSCAVPYHQGGISCLGPKGE